MASTLIKKNGGGAHPVFRHGMLAPLQEEFGDLFSRFWGSDGGEWLTQSMAASMDVSETGDAVEVKLDLPGVQPEDIDVEAHGGVLTIRGERKSEEREEDEKRNFHRMERRYGSFARTVTLPTEVCDEEAVAEFKDGVLSIVLPKVEEAKARHIKVKC